MKKTFKSASIALALIVICTALFACEIVKDPENEECTHVWSAWQTTKNATCVLEGSQERTCQVCHAVDSQPLSSAGHDFDRENGKFEWADTGLEATYVSSCKNCTEKETVTANVTEEFVPADCENQELRTCTATVTVNGKKYIEAKDFSEEPALNHDYDTENATWSWDAEYSFATFTVKCKRDPAHVYSQKCESTFVTTPAGCTEQGSTVYSVAVVFEGKEYTDTKTIFHSAIEHSFDVENGKWIWSDDYSVAKYMITCQNNAAHTDILIATVEIVTTPPSCSAPGENAYIATVEYGEKIFVDTVRTPVDILAHDYNFENATWDWNDDFSSAILTVVCKNNADHTKIIPASIETETTPATCTAAGRIVYTATVVFANKNLTNVQTTDVAALNHDYAVVEVQWGETQATAVITCKNDAKHTHTITAPVTAFAVPETCEEDGAWNYTATFEVDGVTFTEEKSVTIPAHGHDYNNRLCSICKKYSPSQGLSFELMEDGSGYTVCGMGECTDKLLVIPSKHNGLPVVEVAKYAFRSLEGVYEVHIPGSVKVIQVGAFTNCFNIKKIVLEEGIEIIGIEAFQNLPCLREIKLPESVTGIGTKAFAYCSSLLSITIPENVTALGDNAFLDCAKLLEVENLSKTISLKLDINSAIYLERGVRNIYTATDGASKLFTDNNGFIFYEGDGYCYLLAYYGDGSNFALPEDCNGKTYAIYNYAFFGNYGYGFTAKNVVLKIPAAVTQIGNNAFGFCDWIIMVTGGENVNFIGTFAFAGCNELLSVTVGKNVQKMGQSAFNQCKRLVELFNFSGIKATALWISGDRLATHTDPETPTCIYREGDFLFFYDGESSYLLRYIGNDTVVSLPDTFRGKAYEIAPFALDDMDGVEFLPN